MPPPLFTSIVRIVFIVRLDTIVQSRKLPFGGGPVDLAWQTSRKTPLESTFTVAMRAKVHVDKTDFKHVAPLEVTPLLKYFTRHPPIRRLWWNATRSNSYTWWSHWFFPRVLLWLKCLHVLLPTGKNLCMTPHWIFVDPSLNHTCSSILDFNNCAFVA